LPSNTSPAPLAAAAPALLTATTTPAASSPPPAASPEPPAAGAAPQAPPIPAAAQLGQAVAALHIKPDGSSQMTIKLDPAELGHVQVQIGRARNGDATINVAVERLDTMRALQADLIHLHLALDRAGVSDQRSLTLHLSPAPPAPTTAPTSTDNSGFSPNLSQGSSQGFSQSFSQGGGGHAGQGARQPYAAPQPPTAGVTATFTLVTSHSTTAALAGINITA
jgi:hypothetical protein